MQYVKLPVVSRYTSEVLIWQINTIENYKTHRWASKQLEIANTVCNALFSWIRC